MKFKVSSIRILIQEEIQSILESGYKMWHPETMKRDPSQGNHGEYTAAGDCHDDFFGILLGYLGNDEQSAKDFCKIATTSGPGDTLGLALKTFNISQSTGFEIRKAYDHIYQVNTEYEESEEAPFSGWPDKFQEGKRKMKITKSYLKKIIKEEMENMQEAGAPRNLAIIDYDEGGITISDDWRPPTRLDFLPFNDIEGPEEDPQTPDEIENTIAAFFKKNDVREVRDEQRASENIDPLEWLSITLQAMIAGEEHPFDFDPWED
tara:strand:- start:119 stop:907 length:789 start_codon:yes stop_codon:yes gene_type:complete